MSSDNLILDLKMAFRRGGWTNEDIKKLSEGSILTQVLPFVKGLAEINIIKHTIDCNVDPFVPDRWVVEEHKKGGEIEFNPEKFEFYLSEDQQGGKCVDGNKLRRELENKHMLNANVLDYLLSQTYLIPEEWKRDGNGNIRHIFFWGTIYRDYGGDLCVRFLYWFGGRWNWYSYWLDSVWIGDNPALLLAN